MSFRAIKDRARLDLHDRMKVEAYYFQVDPTTGAVIGEPLPVSVRIHSKWERAGDMSGTNLSYAEVEEIAPRIIFMVSEVASPAMNSVVSVAQGEAYYVGALEPRDGLTITANASRLPIGKTVGLPFPEA